MATPTSPDVFRRLMVHYESCFARYGDCARGVDWPDTESAHTRYRVMTEVMQAPDAELLDFGCGAAHLLDYLHASGRNDVRYRGVDLSPVFIDHCRAKYPGVSFDCIDALAGGTTLPEADYIVLNGLFTERCGIPVEEMFAAMSDLLEVVFARARIGIAFNVMSKYVDWERDDLFHLPYDDLARFVVARLSRHHVIRADYGLYEYTAYVYKQPRAGGARE